MTGKLSFNEYDRVAYKMCGKALLDRPFSARREGQSVFWHIETAAKALDDINSAAVIYQDNLPVIAALAVSDAALKSYSKNVKPESVNLNLIIPDEMEEKEAKIYVKEAVNAAEGLGLGIDELNITRGAVNKALISATVTGPKIKRQIYEADKYHILMVGHAGNGAGILLAEKEAAMLGSFYPKHFLDTSDLKEEMKLSKAASKLLESCELCYPVLEGGIFTALWDMLEKLHLGCKINLKNINIKQLVVEMCERLDITPFTIQSGGCALIVTSNFEAAVAMCAEAGLRASVIGELSKSNDRIIENGDEIRYLERPTGDSYKIYNEQHMKLHV